MIVKVIMDLKIQRKLCGFKCIVQKKIGIYDTIRNRPSYLNKFRNIKYKE